MKRTKTFCCSLLFGLCHLVAWAQSVPNESATKAVSLPAIKSGIMLAEHSDIAIESISKAYVDEVFAYATKSGNNTSDTVTVGIDVQGYSRSCSISLVLTGDCIIDWGNGNQTTCSATLDESGTDYQWKKFSHNYYGKHNIKIYTKSENAKIIGVGLIGDYYTHIDSVNITQNPSLMYLYIRGAALKNLNVSQNKKLKLLYCDYNDLTTLDVSNNPDLEVLNCNGNELTTLDVSNNPNLEMLGCADNKLTVLDVTKNTLLTGLNVAINEWRFIDVSGLKNLKMISFLYEDSWGDDACSHINLLNAAGSTSLDTLILNADTVILTGCTALRCLISMKDDGYFSSSGYDSLNIDDCVALKTILEGNRASNGYFFDEELYAKSLTAVGCVSLDTLYLATYTADLTGCTGLSRLVMESSGSSLNVSGCTALLDLSGAFSKLNVNGCAALKQLHCYGIGVIGQLSSLDVSSCTSLQDLHCASTLITSLDVSKNTALKTLICEYSKLTSLDISKNTVLETLNCSNNRELSTLKVSGNTTLKYLNVAQCRLISLDVSKNKALSELNVQGNQITSLSVEGCDSLYVLDCSDNRLTSLDVSSARLLVALSCGTDFQEEHILPERRNQLTSLDLSKNSNLAWLNCTGNLLTSLDLRQNTDLWRMDLRSNRLSELLLIEQKDTSCKEMFFSGNKLALSENYKIKQHFPESMSVISKNGFGMQTRDYIYHDISLSLKVGEAQDLRSEMAFDGEKTIMRVMRDGDILDEKLYKFENDQLSFLKPGLYTVRLTNDHVRLGFENDLVVVTYHIQVLENADNPSGGNAANESPAESALRVYPNPVSNVLSVEWREPAVECESILVRILSLSGRECARFTSGFENMPVDHLPAGLYILEATTSTGRIYHQKIVKR